jgi:isocitrate lyase
LIAFAYAIPVDMGYTDEEEQKYLQEVEDVKQWWSDSRWRYTKRPFTAEQIVQKRGNIKIEYPSNVQAKKLWRIVEDRFKVSLSSTLRNVFGSYCCP